MFQRPTNNLRVKGWKMSKTGVWRMVSHQGKRAGRLGTHYSYTDTQPWSPKRLPAESSTPLTPITACRTTAHTQYMHVTSLQHCMGSMFGLHGGGLWTTWLSTSPLQWKQMEESRPPPPPFAHQGRNGGAHMDWKQISAEEDTVSRSTSCGHWGEPTCPQQVFLSL